MVFARLKAGRVGTYLIDLFHVCAYYVRDLESPGTAKEWLAAVVLDIGTRLSDSVNEGDRTNDKRSALVPQSRETSDSDENALIRITSRRAGLQNLEVLTTPIELRDYLRGGMGWEGKRWMRSNHLNLTLYTLSS